MDYIEQQIAGRAERTPLVGRALELADLSALIEDAARGQGRVVFIEGEAGVGKTRLVNAVLAQAREHGFETFLGVAGELEQRRPFGLIAECLGIRTGAREARRAEIARLLLGPASEGHPLHPGDAPQIEFQVVDAVLTLIEHLCARRHVVIALEDLQWTDPSTLLVLHRLGGLVPELPALILLTARPLPRSPDVDRVLDALRRAGAVEMRLLPLSPDAVLSLVNALLGAQPGPRMQQQVSGAAGNPLFVTELVEALAQSGSITFAEGGAAEVGTVAPPSSLGRTILHRLSFLPEETLDVLRVAAILGTTFAVVDLSTVLDRPAAHLMEPLRAGLRAGILAENDGRLAFRHDLVREALYADTPLSVRQALHRHAAESMMAAGAAPHQVAEHLFRGASHGDIWAVRWLHRAGRETAKRAPAAAAEILQRARDLCDPADAARDALGADLAVALMWVGRTAEAETICREMLARTHDPGVDGGLRLCLVQTLLAHGRIADAVTETQTALATGTLTPLEGARIQAWVAGGLMSAGDLVGAAATAEAAIAAADEAGDDFARCLALGALAATRGLRARWDEGLALVAEAVRLADQSPNQEAHRFQLKAMHAIHLMEMDCLDDARRAIEEGRRLSETLGARWNLPEYALTAALERFFRGEWDDALAEIEAAFALAEETGTRHGLVATAAYKARIALARDDLNTAEAAVAFAEREFAESGPQYRLAWMWWTRALLLEASGKMDQALGVLAGGWDRLGQVGIADERPHLGPDLVRLALARGDRQRAEVTTAQVEEVAAMNPQVATAAGAALRCRGLVNGSANVLLEAARAYRKAPRPYDLACACEDAAITLCQHGRLPEARQLVSDAAEIYVRLGAVRELARMDGRMRPFGLRRGRRGPRGRPKTGWEALTRSEQHIAALVADGLSNPEIAERLFLSRLTVKAHISHALDKLGLHSRVEIAVEAARRRG